jgi:hypothetical protein
MLNVRCALIVMTMIFRIITIAFTIKSQWRYEFADPWGEKKNSPCHLLASL